MNYLSELLQYPFFRNALAGVALISIACAVIGVYIVTRRMVFIAGGITHTCFGGLGLGYFMGWNPLLTAAVFAIAGSLGVDAMARWRVRQDSAIAVVWALGMALGILFVFLTPGYVPELNSFLFGNVLNITRADLWAFSIFAVAAVGIYLLFGKTIVAVSFDEDFARTRHLPVRFINILMMVMVSVGIVLTIKMIGVMLLMSLVSLPQLTAERLTRSYRGMMLISCAVSLIGCIGGLWLSVLIDVPASAVIVILLTLLYALTLLKRN
ncbi:MAG: metal ABC transporter permease [Muribaculaceae bacterium]|nr:metal ABC transporter permease [Muribaculaceae bacterium]